MCPFSSSSWHSALERIEIFDVDAGPLSEQNDQDRQTDGGFRRGDRQNEKHEDLAADIPVEARERDEVEVYRQEHELDAHQKNDDVPAVEEDTGDGDGEQDAGQGEYVGECYHGPFSEAILTSRTRSFERTATCAAMSCGLCPARRRKVRMMAATLATRSITAAICAG